MPGKVGIMCIDYFETQRYRSLIYRIMNGMDNLPDQNVGDLFFTRTWRKDQFPNDELMSAPHGTQQAEVMETSFEGSELTSFKTIGEAVGFALTNAIEKDTAQ